MFQTQVLTFDISTVSLTDFLLVESSDLVDRFFWLTCDILTVALTDVLTNSFVKSCEDYFDRFFKAVLTSKLASFTIGVPSILITFT